MDQNQNVPAMSCKGHCNASDGAETKDCAKFDPQQNFEGRTGTSEENWIKMSYAPKGVE